MSWVRRAAASAGVGLVVVVGALLVATSPASATTHDRYVDIDLTADELGLWLTRADGTVETRGPAGHHGDQPALAVGESVVEFAATPSGAGYWLFTDRGNVFAFGDAADHGGVGHLQLAGAIVAAVPSHDGGGYYLIGADGGIFTLGNAVYHGSVPEALPGVTLDAPVVAISSTAGGYVLVAADGGTFTFGAAAFHGSIPQILPGATLDAGIVGLVPGIAGYLMLGNDGGIFNFGVSRFHGSLAGVASDVVAVAVRQDLSGYLILDAAGNVWPLGDARHIGIDTVTGDGDGSVSYSAVDPRIVRISFDSTDTISVVARDGAGTAVDSLFDGFATATAAGLASPQLHASPSVIHRQLHAPTVAELDVDATGEWSVEILPMSYARHWRAGAGAITGFGPEVVRLTRPDPGTQLSVSAPVVSGLTVVTAHEAAGSRARILANSGQPVATAAVLPTWDGPTILDVRAAGPWTLDLEALTLPRSVDVTGDSVAITMDINFPSSMRDTFTVRDSAIEGCGVIDEGSMISSGVIRRGFSVCSNFAGRWASSVAAHGAEITVVVLGAWEVFDLWHLGRIIPFGSEEHDEILLAGIREGVDALLATGTQVALLEVPCQFPRAGGGLTPLPERGERWRTDHLSDLLRGEALTHGSVHFITTPPDFCDDPAIGDNPSLRWDGTHYGPAGGTYVWNHLRDQLLGLP